MTFSISVNEIIDKCELISMGKTQYKFKQHQSN